ncbi:hypothetical protein B0H21DRAFT_743615 [Amylocystis lapponica]|nr:hypothetical protein B0H21DRAFT_743615 [Amylocystis lapponica]
MHPYRYSRRPYRLFWFVVGAASATVYFRSHDLCHSRADPRLRWRDQAPQPAVPAPDPQNPSAPAPAPPNPSDARRSWQSSWHWHWPREDTAPAQWQEERQRMHALGAHATDTLADVSEATLESLLAAVQGLKAKLAETRALRDTELQELQGFRAEQQRRFEEWRRLQEQEQEKVQAQPPRRLV